MRVTIIPADKFVAVDGVGFHEIDMTSVALNVHAVQWYGAHGEIELGDGTGKVISNERIESLDAFFEVLALYNAIAAKRAAEQTAFDEENLIVEV